MPYDSVSEALSVNPDTARPSPEQNSSLIDLISLPCNRAGPFALFQCLAKSITLRILPYLSLDHLQSPNPSPLPTWTGTEQSSTSSIAAQSVHHWMKLCFGEI